jgi:hypothetical protein
MAIRPPRESIGINISKSNCRHMLLARYLKDSGQISSRSMAAIEAYWYGLASIEDPDSSDEDVELAVLDSLQLLWAQMHRIVDYQRIKRRVNLPAQSLIRFGLIPTASGQIGDLLPPLVRTEIQPLTDSGVVEEHQEDDRDYTPIDLSDDPDLHLNF